MNILILYNSSQTFTNTVYEHISSFAKYSRNRVFFSHVDSETVLDINLSNFDAVGIHYSVRLAYNQISSSVESVLESFGGLKFLFIQDEYDYPKRSWGWIQKLGINLVFTVVPEKNIERIYPKSSFPHTRFVSNLTGYVPNEFLGRDAPPPSRRSLIIGYRGRTLPIRYGKLGIEKVEVGRIVKNYCDQHNVRSNISWDEGSRIYGPEWYEFIASCRSMLGSESGSNVFDWDGTLSDVIDSFKRKNKAASDNDVYREIIMPVEREGLMNQLSPRVFEAIASRTVLVLFEGEYSGVIKPGEHFISLKKDASNLQEVISLLEDDEYVDEMAERAWRDIIASGKYSYQAFLDFVDSELEKAINPLLGEPFKSSVDYSDFNLTPITTSPVRVNVNANANANANAKLFPSIIFLLWLRLPDSIRRYLKPKLKRLLNRN